MPQPISPTEKRKIFWQDLLAMFFIVILGLFFYGATLRGAPGNALPSNNFSNQFDANGKPENATAFELSPERGRFVHLIALGEDHTYALTKELADIAYPDVGYNGSQYFSLFQPGIAYMALPFYLLGRGFNLSQVFSYGFISLLAILGLLFLYKIGRNVFRLPIWAAFATVSIYAFATTNWSYAITLYQHEATVFFLLSGFYAAWKYSRNQKLSWLWAAYAGLVYALSVSVDTPNAILLLPVGLYLVISSVKIIKEQAGATTVSLRLGFLCAVVGFCLGIAPLLYFNQHYLGSWHTVNGSLPNYEPAQAQLATASSTPAVNPDTATAPASDKDVVGFFRQDYIPQGLVVLLVSKDRGLFVYTPIFLLAFLGIFYLFRKSVELEYIILAGVVLTNLLLYSSWGDPWGGWAYGPRYLIPSMGILSLFIGAAVAQLGRRWWFSIICFLLFAYSAATALLGAVTTNADPAEIEAKSLNTGYNFFRNWDFLTDGKSGSFAFNTFFSHAITLKGYFFLLYLILLGLGAVVFFILPYWVKAKPKISEPAD